MKSSVLIIDDDHDLRALLCRAISKEGFTVLEAGDAKTGLSLLEKEEVHTVLSDVNLPDANGVELVQTIKSKFPFTEVVVITGFGTIEDGVKAIKNGAFDYITKGGDTKLIVPLLEKAIDKARLQYRVHQLEQRVSAHYSFDHIIGSSKVISKAKELAAKVAETDATVLLMGETGTGKEVFAQAIHEASKRKLQPFVAVNCSGFGRDILESELFGHKSGAFTGAIKDKKGLVEEATEGTLFLDEIGEMNIDLQAKLLRVLEAEEYYRVGDSKPSKSNVRVIAASNRNLLTEAERGNFRLDLFYRLSVFQIVLPPLSERPEDIEELVNYFIKIFVDRMAKHHLKMSDDFMGTLKAHSWKGNVRELRNVIERAVILSDGELQPFLLPFEETAIDTNEPIFEMSEVEKRHVRKVLHHTRGNKTEAARLMNIGLTTLYRKLQEYEIA